MKLQKDSGANKDVFSDDKGRLMLSELFRSAGKQGYVTRSQISDCLPDSVENVEDATKGIAMICVSTELPYMTANPTKTNC